MDRRGAEFFFAVTQPPIHMKHRCKNLLFLSVPKNTVSRAAFRQAQWPAEPFGLRCVRSLSGVRGAKAFGFVIAFLLLQNGLHAQTDQLAWEAVQTRVSFVIENAGLEVNGKFSQVTGQFVTDAAGKQPVLVTGSAQVKSIDTGIGLRDRHLQGKDYFFASQHPELRMQLLGIEGNKARFAVIIRGKTKTMLVPYIWNQQAGKGQFKCSFTLNRRDFGVGGSSLLMADEVAVSIELDLRKKP